MICSACGDYTKLNYGEEDILLCQDCAMAADEYYEQQAHRNYYMTNEFLYNQTDSSGNTICDSDPGL